MKAEACLINIYTSEYSLDQHCISSLNHEIFGQKANGGTSE